MTRSGFNAASRLDEDQMHNKDTQVSPTPYSQRFSAHPCDVRCAARGGETMCSRVATAGHDGTVARSGFLRGLGALAGITVIGGTTGSLGALFSPGTGALAAGKAKTASVGTGLWLGNAASLTPAQALSYIDPGSGDPALLLRLANGNYVSFDAGCTHGTCTVAYDTSRRLMVCPCHGATFDPARGAAVVVGPAKDPLYQLRIRVDASGNVYYLDAPSGPHINRLKTAPPYTGQTGDDSGDGAGDGGGGEGGDTKSGRVRLSTGTQQLGKNGGTGKASRGAGTRRAPSGRDD